MLRKQCMTCVTLNPYSAPCTRKRRGVGYLTGKHEENLLYGIAIIFLATIQIAGLHSRSRHPQRFACIRQQEGRAEPLRTSNIHLDCGANIT